MRGKYKDDYYSDTPFFVIFLFVITVFMVLMILAFYFYVSNTAEYDKKYGDRVIEYSEEPVNGVEVFDSQDNASLWIKRNKYMMDVTDVIEEDNCVYVYYHTYGKPEKVVKSVIFKTSSGFNSWVERHKYDTEIVDTQYSDNKICVFYYDKEICDENV